MPVKLHCDAPGCRRSIIAPLSVGLYRADLRETGGWWLISSNVGTVAGCCEKHLNQALAERAQRPRLAIADDELAYA
jgi:hypothetical protein